LTCCRRDDEDDDDEEGGGKRSKGRASGGGSTPKPSSLLLSSLELSDTQVYEPYIRALLGTTSHFCEVVVLESMRRGAASGARAVRLEAVSPLTLLLLYYSPA